MKKICLLLILFFTSINILNAQITHLVLVSNYQFSPKDLNVTVGDTIKWKWVNGMHTTTSDSTTGLDVWNAPIDVNDSTFRYVIKAPGTHTYYCVYHVSLGMVGSIIASPATEVKDKNISAVNFSLGQNFPDPFNPSTKIKYSVPFTTHILLKVYDLLGNEVGTLVNEEKPAGKYEVTWHAADLSGGVYFYQMKAGNFIQTKKMILLK